MGFPQLKQNFPPQPHVGQLLWTCCKPPSRTSLPWCWNEDLQFGVDIFDVTAPCIEISGPCIEPAFCKMDGGAIVVAAMRLSASTVRLDIAMWIAM
mmetsp:Transcript_80107/g.132399  ORF Transcript_80107/g.132399 Transcript_80107/m.132399 type:complete len:96 (+) Transcript_80107:838-1125(+)